MMPWYGESTHRATDPSGEFESSLQELSLPGGAPYDGVVSQNHGVCVADSICELERDGHIGFCDLEILTNPRLGSLPIGTALRAINVYGLSRRP